MLKNFTVRVFAIYFCCLSTHANPTYHHNFKDKSSCLVICHALGGIDGNTYTNSIEAITANLEKGCRVFEADFSPLDDGQWVLTHDWKLWQRQTKYSGILPPTYEEFLQYTITKKNKEYHPATVEMLENLVQKYPDMLIITDTKYHLRPLAIFLMKTKLPANIIWQAYDLSEVDFLVNLKQPRIILTLYKMNPTNIKGLANMLHANYADKLIGLTVPLGMYLQHMHDFAEMKFPIYLHGHSNEINSPELHQKLQGKVAGFYLDR